MSSLICLHLLLCSGAFFVPLKRIVVDLAIRLPFPLSAYWGHTTTTTTPLYWPMIDVNDDDDDDDDADADALTTMDSMADWLDDDDDDPVNACLLDDASRAHVHLRWKTTKRAISFTVPETFCKTDVREYNTLFTLSELLYFFLDKSIYEISHISSPFQIYFSTFLFSPRCFKITHRSQLLSKKQVTFYW